MRIYAFRLDCFHSKLYTQWNDSSRKTVSRLPKNRKTTTKARSAHIINISSGDSQTPHIQSATIVYSVKSTYEVCSARAQEFRTRITQFSQQSSQLLYTCTYKPHPHRHSHIDVAVFIQQRLRHAKVFRLMRYIWSVVVCARLFDDSHTYFIYIYVCDIFACRLKALTTFFFSARAFWWI